MKKAKLTFEILHYTVYNVSLFCFLLFYYISSDFVIYIQILSSCNTVIVLRNIFLLLHRLPVFRYSRDSNKGVIVKFVNRNHPEAMLRKKKSISSKDFSHLNVHGKVFVSVSLCPYYRYIWGKSAKTCKEEGKSIKSFALAVL